MLGKKPQNHFSTLVKIPSYYPPPPPISLKLHKLAIPVAVEIQGEGGKKFDGYKILRKAWNLRKNVDFFPKNCLFSPQKNLLILTKLSKIPSVMPPCYLGSLGDNFFKKREKHMTLRSASLLKKHAVSAAVYPNIMEDFRN